MGLLLGVGLIVLLVHRLLVVVDGLHLHQGVVGRLLVNLRLNSIIILFECLLF